MEDMRLSKKDQHCRKSMNTMLHVLEAYTNLLSIWQDEKLKQQHWNLLEIFIKKIINQKAGHLNLFFDDQWNLLSDRISYGHGIEASWLLLEAAKVHEDEDLLTQLNNLTMRMAEAVLREGVDTDGSIFYEGSPGGITDSSKEWWVQAEAVVGFYNAYKKTGEIKFANAAYRVWSYINDKMIDWKYGDWLKRLFRDGTPDHERYKAGPWECPYHHSRMCFEMMTRLEA